MLSESLTHSKAYEFDWIGERLYFSGEVESFMPLKLLIIFVL